MPAPPEPDPDDMPAEDADLVAYLDGEADPAAAKRVAGELAADPATRKKAEALKKTFDLLDFLPKPDASPTFTTKTLTKLDAVSGSRPVPAVDSPRTNPLVWVALGVVLFTFGFVVHRFARPYLTRPAEPDLADLPILDRLPLYAGVDDLAYLKQLDTPDLFGEEFEAIEPGTAPVPPANHRAERIALFRSYPAARRQQIRDLHRDLTALPDAEQDHLNRVLEAYAGWLARLPEKMRKEVLDAPTADARLAAVRQVRNRLWEDALPASQREKLNLTTNADERVRLVKEWRDREHDRQLEWRLAARQWSAITENRKPWPFSDETLAKDVDTFVRNVFKPDALAASQRLTIAEVNKLVALRAATGQNAAWLPYGAYVLQLSEKYPTLPEPPFGTVLTESDLSQLALTELRKREGPLKQRYRFVQGKWPDFALAIARDLKDPKPANGNKPLGPCQPGEFTKPVNDFLTNELTPKLTVAEVRRLDAQKGKWPDYPKVMIELAKAKDLTIPGVTLPGKPSLWTKYYRYTPTKDDPAGEK
jgi:hypothetical protein